MLKEAKFLLDIEMSETGASMTTDIQGKYIDIVAMICAALKDKPELREILKLVVELYELEETLNKQ